MDIEEFYDADDRRRTSAEIELGTEWRDGAGVRYELTWIMDTGELYVMREPVPHEWSDPFGGIHVQSAKGAPTQGMTVTVIAHIGNRQELDRVLDGWQDHMAEGDSISWLVRVLRDAGVASWPSGTKDR